MTKMKIREKIREWDTIQWKAEIYERSSLEIYRAWRKNIGGMDNTYDNAPSSITLYKA